MRPAAYIVILVIMFSFLLLSRLRFIIVITAILFLAVTLIRYLFWAREREEEIW